jgi:hypothetical protein
MMIIDQSSHDHAAQPPQFLFHSAWRCAFVNAAQHPWHAGVFAEAIHVVMLRSLPGFADEAAPTETVHL